jgi:CubicO group peptidase (beta-lactamase class C family)
MNIKGHPAKKLLLWAVSLLLLISPACSPGTIQPPPPQSPVPPTYTSAVEHIPTMPPTPVLVVITPELISDIDAWLDKLARDGLFSGSVLIAHRDNVLLSQGYGLANREQNIPNTPQTRFRLASITKQFTAMAILILEAQGRLNVEDPICTYLTDCPSAWETITIHQLITHTSGIPETSGLPDYRSSRATPSSPEKNIARFRDLPLDFPPGENWSYSNSGYILLGYIIEQVSGLSYEEFLKQTIFTPLKMNNTAYDHNDNNLAVGYTSQYSSLPADFVDVSFFDAAGALYSTIEDLYRWDQALYTEILVPQPYLDRMFAQHITIPYGKGESYGYGWTIDQESGRTLIMHAGGLPGVSTIIARYPQDRITIIALSNNENTNAPLIRELLARQIFDGD